MRTRVARTIALLFAGYGSIYFCRSILPATAPLLIADLHGRGMSASDATVTIGALASIGTLAYAFGKFFLTGLADFFGGKRILLAAMFGAVAFTAVFATSSIPAVLTLAWIGNRLFQSMGWAGLVKVSSKWLDYAAYGSAMAVLSLSFLIGDAATRAGAGALIGAGFGWRAIFLIAAAALALVFLVVLVFLKESRTDAGLAPPDVNPINVFGESGAQDRPTGLRALVLPLVGSPAFWIVCALSFGTTLLREALATWTPTYYVTGAGFDAAHGAGLSALSPIAGAFSVLGCGWLSDRLGPIARARITLGGLILATITLGALGVAPKGAGWLAVVLVVAVQLFNSGPYSYLAGAMALDFGGKKGSALSSGIIDGVGYVGASLAGIVIARLEVAAGWGDAFGFLAAVTAITAACAVGLVTLEKREFRRHG
ncbi:MAG: MFS transporter [Candidatus Eremiobacteraeota bacterium]|nr:MFS transporter [Candidatus Eremiobacteraeota bacterium]